VGRFVSVYLNGFGGLNLGAAVERKQKIWTNKNEGSIQIKSRGSDLGAPAGVALNVKYKLINVL
jgi:hypothetical protein